MKKNIPTSSRNAIESLMFASRWLQLPLYVGLIIALGAYTYEFFVHLWEVIELIVITRSPERHVILEVLDIIDIVISIVTIGAVRLLATFVNAAQIEMETILMQIAIQVVLMATAITIVIVDRLSVKHTSLAR